MGNPDPGKPNKIGKITAVARIQNLPETDSIRDLNPVLLGGIHGGERRRYNPQTQSRPMYDIAFQ